MFALYAVCVGFFGVVLLFWRRPKAESENRRERFLPALRAGGRYVWHEPIVRRILLRTILFVAPAVALWALLPLVASQRLGLGADGYGALFGVGPRSHPRCFCARTREGPSVQQRAADGRRPPLRSRLGRDRLDPEPVALVILVLAGVAWMAMTSTLAAELQLFLPVWVRARALAVFMLTFTGSMTVGALLWGLVAESFGLQPHSSSQQSSHWRASSRECSCACRRPVTSTASRPSTGRRRDWPSIPSRIPDPYWSRSSTRSRRIGSPPSSKPWTTFASLGGEQGNALGAVPRRRPARPLYRTLQRPILEEHMRQHEGRLTAADREVEEAAPSFSDPPARAEHLAPP